MDEFWRTLALLVSAQWHDCGTRFPPEEVVRTASATARAYEAARKDQTYADAIEAFAAALQMAVALKERRLQTNSAPDGRSRIRPREYARS